MPTGPVSAPRIWLQDELRTLDLLVAAGLVAGVDAHIDGLLTRTDGSVPDSLDLADALIERGFSIDGKSGLPLVKLAKNAMGLALAAERHGSMFMNGGARLAGMLTSAAPMKEPERQEHEAAGQRQYAGHDGQGGSPAPPACRPAKEAASYDS